MSKVTAKIRGMRWNFTTVLEDLDFADNIGLQTSKFNGLREKTRTLKEKAARLRAKLNAKKCKTLRTEHVTKARREFW